MHMHSPNEPVSHETEEHPGYEATDVNPRGILVFLVGLGVSVLVFFVVCFVFGKVINGAIVKEDGPPNQWNLAGGSQGKPQNLESNPAMAQQQLQQLTQRFPTPRLQTDDGNQDVADMHAREDLLLGHYSWVDQSKGVVRIPIDRAMELVAQRGLPVASPSEGEPLMTADEKPTVTAPLTNGYVPTTYEQEQQQASKAPGEQASTKANNH